MNPLSYLPAPVRVLGVVVVFCAVSGCGLNEFDEQRAKLKPLSDRKASKEEVIALLGTDFIFYSKGRTNWEHLTTYLSREPSHRLVAVRAWAGKCPHIMSYTTPDMMTWVFLDDRERVVHFVVGAQ